MFPKLLPVTVTTVPTPPVPGETPVITGGGTGAAAGEACCWAVTLSVVPVASLR